MPAVRISTQQQRAVERMARDRSIVCLHCGNAALTSGDTASVGYVWVNVDLVCRDPDAEHVPNIQALDKAFNLTPVEAASIGIPTLPDPEPRRPHGGTVPYAE